MFIIVHLQLIHGFKLNLVSSFSSYMGFEPNSTIQNQKITEAFSDSYYINNCLYEDIKSGAIRLTNLLKSLYLVIEECSFAFCEVAREGGAICMISTECKLVISKACGFSCFSHIDNGQFLYIYTTFNENTISSAQLSLVSISECAPWGINKERNAPLYAYQTNFTADHVNASKNCVSSNSFCHLVYSNCVSFFMNNIQDNSC